MTQTKHENRQSMETKDTYFCEEIFIGRSLLVFQILSGECTSYLDTTLNRKRQKEIKFI